MKLFSIAMKPQQPVLVVASQADRLVDYRCGLKLARAWSTDYLQHKSAGHDLPLDDPTWLVHVIKQWCISNFVKT